MGRPPVGKRAMTSTERQRRFWERKLQHKLQQQLARAKKRIAELEKLLHQR